MADIFDSFEVMRSRPSSEGVGLAFLTPLASFVPLAWSWPPLSRGRFVTPLLSLLGALFTMRSLITSTGSASGAMLLVVVWYGPECELDGREYYCFLFFGRHSL